MKTDRELLELAAKAAGYEAGNFEADGIYIWPPGRADQIRLWRPLADDGDALRLAVDLRLLVLPVKGQGHIKAGIPAGIVVDSYSAIEPKEEPYGDDPHAATRRAIVRAAAAIGSAP